jgi:hypothetical protein
MKSDPSGFWANDVTNPPWLSWGARVTADGNPCVQSGHGSACRWDVEISIDTTLGASAGVPASFEQFYVDVVEWISTGPADPNPINHQFSWPPGNILQDASDPSTTLTPAPSMWGAASVGTTSLCKGVYFGSSDISVGNLQADGNLKVGVASPITANLHNNGSTAATGVIAHFAHAPFGLCPNPWVFDESCYTDIGQTAAPSIGTSGVTPVSKTWTPVPGDVGGAANQHTCLRVRLESTAGGTTFVNQGDFKNMYVDHASTAASTPIINMKAAAPPIGGGPTRVRLVEQRGAQFAYGDGALSAVPIGALTSQGRIVYRGYRYTGKHLTVGGIASEIWEPVGAYGYTIQHVLAAQTQVAFETRHKGLFDRFTNPVTTVGGGTTTTTGTTLPGQGAGTVVPRELATNTNATGTTSGGSVATGTGGTATFAPAVYQAVNEDLAVLTDRPAATDFSADLQGAKVVSASGAPKVVEIELPAEGVATVPTSISFVGTDQPPPGCPGCATTSTATKVSSIGFMILGVLAIKRRRR